MNSNEKSINFNTVLLTILLALGGWTLTRVSTLSEQVAVGAEKATNQSVSVAELRTRVVAVELQVQSVKLDVMRFSREKSATP